MTTYAVLLTDGTVGELKGTSLDHPGQPFEGEKVRVTLHDENGNIVTRTGLVAEVLDSSDLYE